MQAPILQMEKWSDAILNQDRLRDLLMIAALEAIKHEVILFMLNTINVVIVL
jgi:hypothetical protein